MLHASWNLLSLSTAKFYKYKITRESKYLKLRLELNKKRAVGKLRWGMV